MTYLRPFISSGPFISELLPILESQTIKWHHCLNIFQVFCYLKLKLIMTLKVYAKMFLKIQQCPGIVVYGYNPHIQEAKAGGS
jgi:hypothetical protein